MLRRALAFGKHGIVVWIDADALVVDQEKPLEFFLSQASFSPSQWCVPDLAVSTSVSLIFLYIVSSGSRIITN